MLVTEYLWSQGVVTLQYLDDCLVGPMPLGQPYDQHRATEDAIAVTLSILLALGYTLALNK